MSSTKHDALPVSSQINTNLGISSTAGWGRGVPLIPSVQEGQVLEGREHRRALTFFADTQAALQLGQRDDLVLVQVTVVGETPGALLGLGFLLHVALEGLHLALADVAAAVAVQLAEVPMHHALLQGVAGVWLREPGPRADTPPPSSTQDPTGTTSPTASLSHMLRCQGLPAAR